MARRNTQSVNNAIYRHFAVVTLVATGALALFVNGENAAPAHASAIPAPPPAAAPAPAKKSPFAGSLSFKGTAASRGGGFGEDTTDYTFGAPMDPVGDSGMGGGGGTVDPAELADAPAPTGALPDGYSKYGVTKLEWARLSEDQRAQLIARWKKAQADAATAERAQERASLLQSSAFRSRAGGSGD